MRGAKAFVDTNILLYLFSYDKAKKAQSLSSLRDNVCLISVQVAMEFCNVYTKKFRHTPEEARFALGRLRKMCDMRLVTAATIDRALDVQARYGFSFYDSVNGRLRSRAWVSVFVLGGHAAQADDREHDDI